MSEKIGHFAGVQNLDLSRFLTFTVQSNLKFTQDFVSTARCASMTARQEVQMTVPNSQIPASVSLYVPTAMKKITRDWYNASNMFNQNE